MIKDNLEVVEKNIRIACDRAGRDRKDVTLIAVSKTKPIEDIREAIEEGIAVFGENKVQELLDKTSTIKENMSWHMIGHLQVNKVKYLPGRVCMIHSVDNVRLAEEIDKRFSMYGQTIDVLVEVNMAEEDSKFGIAPDQTIDFVKGISTLSHLNIRGLMTIAPYTENPESNRVYFKGLKGLMDKINGEHIDGIKMDTLSMGMTGDYQIAIEEGATFIRVGTGIFGERDYNKTI